jgi:HD superfamily phosphohydrolase
MHTIPELIGLDSHIGSIRIPPEFGVPLTERVRRIIDTESFRRLAKLPQVGLVSLVYPAARHTRFEHSLGVYRLALLLLKRLSHVPDFTQKVTRNDAERLIVTALLHDLGHYPFCHLIEDIRIKGLPHHEKLAAAHIGHSIEQSELAELLRKDWNVEPSEVINLLTSKSETPVDHLLASILSGPIDIDKMDYLHRDSLHAGVPYGRQLDQERLISSLCLNASGDGLAITEKGKTAAELMIFARYVMFSEVYWHHTVRSATAMLQRLFCELYLTGQIEFSQFVHFSEDEAIRFFLESSKGTPMEKLAQGLFGARRTIYKRVAQFSILEQEEMYRQLAGKPYRQLCGQADWYSAEAHAPPLSVLIDAPPVEKEIEIKIDVHFPKLDRFMALEDLSPVVRAMAKEQFDDYAKRVRIYARPLEF